MSEAKSNEKEPPVRAEENKYRKECGARLTAERERLDVESVEFATMLGFGKSTQYRYERGERSPDGEYLSAAYKNGIDILYVITGNRSKAGVMQERAAYSAAERLAETIKNLTLSESDAEILKELALRLVQ